MVSKKITDEDIISYINKELDDKTSNLIGKMLKTDEALKLRIDSFKNLDDIINTAAAKEYPIPSHFLKTVQNTVSEKKVNEENGIIKSILNKLEGFSALSLISGSAFSGAVVAGFCVLSFISYNNSQLINYGNKSSSDIAFSDNQNSDAVSFKNSSQLANRQIPQLWTVNKEFAFAVDYYSDGKLLNLAENVNNNLINDLVLNIIPLKTKTIKIDYINNKKEKINIYSRLTLEKGKTFISKKIMVSDSIWIDKILIYENDNLILEQNILTK